MVAAGTQAVQSVVGRIDAASGNVVMGRQIAAIVPGRERRLLHRLMVALHSAIELMPGRAEILNVVSAALRSAEIMLLRGTEMVLLRGAEVLLRSTIVMLWGTVMLDAATHVLAAATKAATHVVAAAETTAHMAPATHVAPAAMASATVASPSMKCRQV